jgi:hypothetical protein
MVWRLESGTGLSQIFIRRKYLENGGIFVANGRLRTDF